MIKCEVIKEFTLEKFDELKNVERKRIDVKGKLFVEDTFECTKEMAEYLTGKNKDNVVVVKIIEVIPEKTTKVNINVKDPEIKGETVLKYVEKQEKPKTTKKKTTKKTTKSKK